MTDKWWKANGAKELFQKFIICTEMCIGRKLSENECLDIFNTYKQGWDDSNILNQERIKELEQREKNYIKTLAGYAKVKALNNGIGVGIE